MVIFPLKCLTIRLLRCLWSCPTLVSRSCRLARKHVTCECVNTWQGLCAVWQNPCCLRSYELCESHTVCLHARHLNSTINTADVQDYEETWIIRLHTGHKQSLCLLFIPFGSCVESFLHSLVLKKLTYRVSKITETMKWVFVLSSWTGQKCFITADLNPGNVSYIQICCSTDVTADFTTQECQFYPVNAFRKQVVWFFFLENFVGINLLSQQKTPNKTWKIHTVNWTLCSLSLLYSQLVLYSNNVEWMSDTLYENDNSTHTEPSVRVEMSHFAYCICSSLHFS